jgi:hypothetical protein
MRSMPKSTATTPDDCADLKQLLLWARANRFALRTAAVGTATVEIAADIALADGKPPAVPDKRDAENLYRVFGGEAVEKALGEANSGGALIEDDEDEPALPPRRRR